MLLKDSLGGNSKSVMIATIALNAASVNETTSTLRAKLIKNNARINMLLDAANSEKLREEIMRLQGELEWFKSQASGSGEVVGGLVGISESSVALHPFNLGLVRSLSERNEELDYLLHSEAEELTRVKEILDRKDAMMQHERMVLRLKDDQIARLKSGCTSGEVEVELREEIIQLRSIQENNPALKESALKVFKLEQRLRRLEPFESELMTLESEREKRSTLDTEYVCKLQEWEATYESMSCMLDASTVPEMQAELDLARQTVMQGRSECEEVKRILREKERDLEASLEHIDGLEQEMESKHGYFEGLQAEICGVREEFVTVEGKLKDVQGICNKLEFESVGLKSELDAARRDIQAKDVYVAELNKQIDIGNARISESSYIAAALDSAYTSSLIKITTLKTEKLNLSNSNHTFQQSAQDLTRANLSHQLTITSQTTQLTSLQTELTILNQDKLYLESTMHSVIRDNTQSLRNVELIQELSSLQTVLQSEKEKIDSSTKEHAEVVGKLLEKCRGHEMKLGNIEVEYVKAREMVVKERDVLALRCQGLVVEVQSLEDDYEDAIRQRVKLEALHGNDKCMGMDLYEEMKVNLLKAEEALTRSRANESDLLNVREEIVELKAENVKLLQHSNHKQKLQYMVQLKRENNSLKQELSTIHRGKEDDKQKGEKENAYNEIY